ncbi:PD-(D/E)XK nuclease family protein [Aquimarina pacifica]|uniref:PD-(D/E)XK nuclease family protein n=1 Tax=Aquimarina pacifica TaxID=1296415 RepID=UPI00046EACAA|nr:PD-(D/E)XK nuclease family protein [Aquimarina pacifica]
MKSFLNNVIVEISKSSQNISDIVFLVPSKRAGLFLKKELLETYSENTFFAPIILSIEEFIEQLSGLQQIDNVETLFEFYNTYLTIKEQEEKESFETFRNWAQTLIYDFNEIDRYCIDHKSFFAYLSGIQDINHWYLQTEKTTLVKNYIQFWKSLLEYYENFRDTLLFKKVGYQGLLYRRASEEIHTYIKKENRKHVLVGFNALNNAEQIIFQALLEAGIGQVFWDADAFFVQNNYHEASLFLRNYKKQWGYYKDKPFEWIQDNFSQQKNITYVGVPKNIGQAKAAGRIVQSISKMDIEKTALVLADESLLQPVLNSLPDTIESLNITMGLPLSDVPLSSFFELLFAIHKTPSLKGLYYKPVLDILNSPQSNRLLGASASHLIKTISKENIVYLTVSKILEQSTDHEKKKFELLFAPWTNVNVALGNCRKIIQLLKDSLDAEKDELELECVYHFHLIFNKLANLQSKYTYLDSIASLYTLYKDILTSETLDFSGEPFRGLQLMGMLESRCLDFETVIITSVNEGVLPAGKSINSFIPYDLKRAYNLPTYKEKDAIYTYHFYRLIQRAKNVYLLYNTENDGVGGGEKSRFLLQLDIDKRPNHTLKKYMLSSEVPIFVKQPLKIDKNQDVLEKLQKLGAHGLSPSALTSYIRNPMEFYYTYILGVRDTDEVEETIAANTLGTVIHNTLENFYKPFENQFLTLEGIKKMENQIDKELLDQFRQEYNKLDITQGKNLLIFEVAKRYIFNFLKSEEKILRSGGQLKIIAVESNLKCRLEIPELDFPIFIKGKVDRIDELNGELRVIDYKTGKVTRGDVVIMDWDTMTQDYKYSKAIQVLAYAYMYHNEKQTHTSFQAGIISFKNLKEGYLRFGTKNSVRSKPNHEITNSVLDEYLVQLKKLIIEIFNIEIPFIEKEV